jgi:hypothetical protein
VFEKRWEWIEDCEDWPAFGAWRESFNEPDRVELEAGLRTLLRRGPEYGFAKLAEDIFAVSCCRRRTVFTVVVGVAQSNGRLLLPLAWVVNADDRWAKLARDEATEKLKKWRETGGAC